VLAEGRVARAGPKNEIFERPRSLAVARLTGCKNLAVISGKHGEYIQAAEWDCRLRVAEAAPERAGYVGIRAHHVQFGENGTAENTFSCWLVGTVESPL